MMPTLSERDKGRFDGWSWARASEQGDTYPLPGDDVSVLWAFGFQQGRDAWVNKNDPATNRWIVAQMRALDVVNS